VWNPRFCPPQLSLKLGGVAIVIGFALTLAYFAILGNSIGGGQTIGHRITQIQVVGRGGEHISLTRSLLRYLIVLGPILLTSAVLPSFVGHGIKASIDWLFFGAEIVIVYLYVFNTRTRQSLHDLATNTYVVDALIVGRVEFPRIWPWHWAILGGSAFVGLALLIGFGNTIRDAGPYPELIVIQKAVLDSGSVQSADVSIQKNWSNGKTSTGLIVSVVWRGDPTNIERSATEIAKIVLQADSHASGQDFVTVRFLEGYSIGFATFNKNRQVSHSPEIWIKQIQDFGLRQRVNE
jgi:uncharacterized RDD family membrane protein YckC